MLTIKMNLENALNEKFSNLDIYVDIFENMLNIEIGAEVEDYFDNEFSAENKKELEDIILTYYPNAKEISAENNEYELFLEYAL